MFKNINKILDLIIKEKDKTEYLGFEEIKKKWNKSISNKIKENSQIIDYKDKTITIKAKTPAWRNEINFLKQDIKKKYKAISFQ
tara:strand:- start:13 stop:264 length:252 start_codon:yes stop_codon:yes gene_type:complete